MLNLLNPERELLEGLREHKQPSTPQPSQNLLQDDRWLAASSMQKAIRCGYYKEALHAAHIVKAFNPSHLWTRLRVIVLEDIGAANLNIVSQVLWVAGKEQWRNKNRGQDFVLSYIIHRLCQSKKSRTLDDALYVAEYHPLYKPQRNTYAGLTEKELMALFSVKSLNVIERILVCRYLCGRRYRSEVLELSKGNPVRLMELGTIMNAPPYVLDILGLSKAQEYFTCLLPCLMQVEQSQECTVVSVVNDNPSMCGGYLSAAYDRHTRNGKQSFRQFLKSCPEVLAFIRKYSEKADPVDMMGWAVFILEGRRLNKRLVYEGSENIRELAAQAWLCSGGLKVEGHEEFLGLVAQNWGKLDDARRMVAR